MIPIVKSPESGKKQGYGGYIMQGSKLIVEAKPAISRRSVLQGATAAAAGFAAGPGFIRYAQAASSEPIRIGFQVHRTGIEIGRAHV